MIDSAITREELRKMAAESFGNFVKAVVDIRKRVMTMDASLHADEEAYLIQNGSRQSDLWGINLYPDLIGDDFIEFDSMINLRPNQKNLSRGVDDPDIQNCIRRIVASLVK